MIRFLASGDDATASQGNFKQATALYHSDAMVLVLSLPPEEERTDEAIDELVHEVRAALGQGQAVILMPWKPEQEADWKWVDRHLASIIGGVRPDGSVSLEKEVQWQCKAFPRM